MPVSGIVEAGGIGRERERTFWDAGKAPRFYLGGGFMDAYYALNHFVVPLKSSANS